MKAKTIQKMSPVVVVYSDKGFDRYKHSYEPFRQLLQKLIEQGEIPRFKGDETSEYFEADSTVIEMTWNSRQGAEQYAAGLRALDPNCEIVFSIEIQDVTD